MNNFDLKRFLTENKLTTVSKLTEGEKVDLTKPLPALDKPLKDIGMEINKKLGDMGYTTQTVSDPTKDGDALENGGDKKLAVLAYQELERQGVGEMNLSATLEIRVHKNNADDLKKIVDSYGFDSENGGYIGSFSSGDLVRAEIAASEKK